MQRLVPGLIGVFWVLPAMWLGNERVNCTPVKISIPVSHPALGSVWDRLQRVDAASQFTCCTAGSRWTLHSVFGSK